MEADKHAAKGKMENNNNFKGSQSHKFRVKFWDDSEEYIVYCDQSHKVLQAIKTLYIYEKKICCPDEKVIIVKGDGDNKCSIAIHFPCSFIRDNEVLIVSCERRTDKKIQPDRRIKISIENECSIIYISTKAWKNTKTKMFLKNKNPQDYLCVYGKKGITVEEALKADGRFIDDLSNFKLLDNEENSIECTEKLDNLDNKKFKIFLPEKQRTADSSQSSLMNENFSDVHTIGTLLKRGKSICKVSIKGVYVGTGFVLWDTFILTSAHLFKDYVKGKKLQDVLATFHYENPEEKDNEEEFIVEDFIDSDAELNYAVLKFKAEGSKTVPKGLLKKFEPWLANGKACVIGYPAEGGKKMDLKCIIETDKTGQAADEILRCLFKINSNGDYFRKQGTENKLEVGNKAEKVATDHTLKYHGASGSPLFNSHGKVSGLHIGRKTNGFTEEAESVIEYGCPLIIIFEKLVNNLNENTKQKLLEKVKGVLNKNKKNSPNTE